MSYSNYEHYKNSGENNIGLIPLNWKVAKLYMLSKRYAGGTPDKNTPEYWESGTVPWLNSGSVNQFLITTPSNYITSDALEKSSAKWVPKGALLIALAGQGKTKGMVAQTSFDTTCNQSMAAIICRKIDSRYMLWWLVSQYENIRGLSSIDGRDGLNLEMIGGIKCPLPSREEQKAIAAFLDKKTTEIDALIEKKQKLIQLLEEKRSALISQVVTKGLDPNLPMKDSGINWLGKIPDCWDLKRIKFYVRSINKKIHYENTKLPYIGLENIESWTGKKIEDNSVTSEGVVCCFEAKDVLFGKLRPYLAKTYLAKDDGTCSTEFLVFRPCAYVDPEYLQYFLLSPKFINTVNASTYGAKMPRANWEFIANLYLACPSLLVQKQIVQFLNDKTLKIDLIKTKIKEAIERLKEYRAALITNAVTGKIALTAEKDKRFAYE